MARILQLYVHGERKVTGVACPMIAPPGRVAATRLRRGACNPPLMERTRQADKLSEDDTSGSLSEQVSDHDTPGEMSKRYHLACHEIAKKFGGAQDMFGFLERNWIVRHVNG